MSCAGDFDGLATLDSSDKAHLLFERLVETHLLGRARSISRSASEKSAGSTAFLAAMAFSSICSKRVAPIMADATSGSRRVQARANWASVNPAVAASGLIC